ncbi:hypothetical protein JTE90_011980 [Oedothorax gibbosus]|uniref:Uncharacterized protein n=1 Tax=Oedothorax gibbosus TaxID=931172 RepID=A0AAV6TH44_9ARAC|nr:hypothetical protein JTE90_011980 [Oedothorax gibbosus]
MEPFSSFSPKAFPPKLKYFAPPFPKICNPGGGPGGLTPGPLYAATAPSYFTAALNLPEGTPGALGAR